MPGTGLVADPDEIRRYGTAVGDQESPLARINAALAGTALAASAFGILPEAGDLYQAYTRHADEVRQVMAKLPAEISEVASGLYSTAAAYAGIEGDLAAGIRQIYELPGSGGSGGTAFGTGTSVFAGIVSATMSAYDWINEPEESLPALASVEAAQGGIGGMIDDAINWVISHVPELPKLLNDVTGDLTALQAAAVTWHDQGVALNGVIRGLKTPAACFPEAWAGQASASFGEFMADVTTSLSTIAGAMGQTQEILQDAAKESAFAHDTIVMIIQQVVEWVAGSILVDALTLGLGTVADAAGTAAFLGEKVEQAEQAASRLASVYKALKEIVESLTKLKEGVQEAEGLARLKKFMSLGKDFDETALEAAKLRNLRVFSDGKLAKAADMIWDTGKHGKNAEEIGEVLKMGRTDLITRIGVKATLAGTVGATGLPATSGLKGLGQAYLDGTLDDLKDNGQGFAETVHLEPPPVNRISQLLNAPPPADQEK